MAARGIKQRVPILRRATKGKARRRNPVPASSVEEQVEQGARLYKRFTGHEVEFAEYIDQPEQPNALVVIGEIDFVGYTTIRDGVVEKYIHRFKAKARPLFTVTPDGSSIVLLGGAYDFTERGIVDQS